MVENFDAYQHVINGWFQSLADARFKVGSIGEGDMALPLENRFEKIWVAKENFFKSLIAGECDYSDLKICFDNLLPCCEALFNNVQKGRSIAFIAVTELVAVVMRMKGYFSWLSGEVEGVPELIMGSFSLEGLRIRIDFSFPDELTGYDCSQYNNEIYILSKCFDRMGQHKKAEYYLNLLQGKRPEISRMQILP